MSGEKGNFTIKLLTIAAVALVVFAAVSPAQQIDPHKLRQLEYRHIGPQGNRVLAVAGIPGDPTILYAGAATGGVWKSIDGGVHWKPIFDDQTALSIGSLAVAPSDPNIIWVGTGEAFIRGNISIGNGIYLSTDAGETWTNMGLENTGRIGRILIDPRDPNIVFAAAMGHCYGPQPERGVFRTTDGGKTWEKVLFVDENTGSSDIAMDPNNPRILYAGMWQLLIRTWGRRSGGPGSGLHKSTDGGTTWNKLSGHGLPTTTLGKIAVAIAPSDSKRIYTLIETGDGIPKDDMTTTSGVLWRSDDGGKHWKLVNSSHTLTQRPHYYSRLAVAPDNPNDVYFMAPQLSRSIDGGLTYFNVQQEGGGDRHDMWIDPTNPKRIVLGTDHDVNITVNRGLTWTAVRLPIAQVYHVAVDNQIPYNVYGNRQDGPSFRGPSRSLLPEDFIPPSLWTTVGGCESGFAIPDPEDNNIVWSGCYAAGFDRFDFRTGHAQSVKVWPENYMGWPAADVKYRFQWTFPIAISPHDHNKVYVGSQHVHQTTDGGHSWQVISPDLSTNDKEMQQSSGGLASDNLGVEYGCVVFAIAESPLEEGVIWAGTNDGLVQVTRDGGTNWTDVTSNIPDLPPAGTVSNIEPSRYNAGTCYVTVDFHQVNIRDPFIYKTTDYGQSWKSISSDIPKSVFSYAHCVREDPVREGLLYAGTENALYVSFNDGANWTSLQSNLPHAPVHWITLQDHFNDLVVATYGRGFWILDDITPLQQLSPEIVESEAHVFEPRPAYRFREVTTRRSPTGDQCNGTNPPYGASINYYLPEASKEDVTIEILDENNQLVRTLEGKNEAGINRIWWDLRHEPSRQAKLRTPPLHAPHVEVGPEGWRPIVTWGVRGSGIRPLAMPGTYTVKLKANGREPSQKLTVWKDPHSAGSDADVRAKVTMSLEIRDNLSAVVDMINQVEWIRKQLIDLRELLKDETLVEAVDQFDKKLIAFEENLFQMRLTGGGQDVFRNPSKLYARFGFLDQSVSTSDFPPTAQEIEVHELLKGRLTRYQGEFRSLLDQDLPAFNNMLKEANVLSIVVTEP